MVYLYKLLLVKYILGKIKYYICGEKKNYNYKKVICIFGLFYMNRWIGVGVGWLIEMIYLLYDYVGFIFYFFWKMLDYVYIK